MTTNPFDVLIGLRLSIVRRAADMLVAHFGEIRPHPSREGTVGDYALHVQCPWRFDGPVGTITGRDDLWEYAGPGERPDNWSYEDGSSLQDERLSHFFARDERTGSWVNERDRFRVTGVEQMERGEVRVVFFGWLRPAGVSRKSYGRGMAVLCAGQRRRSSDLSRPGAGLRCAAADMQMSLFGNTLKKSTGKFARPGGGRR